MSVLRWLARSFTQKEPSLSVLHWLAQSFAQHSRFDRGGREPTNRRRPARLSVTLLEDRLAPAILTVNSLADAPLSAAGSALTLRDAIALIDSGGTAVDASGRSLAAAKASEINTANPFGSDDVIQFAPSLFASGPQQIVLTDGALVLDRSATITGPAADQLAINGNDQSTVFKINAADVSLSDLTIEDGAAAGMKGGGGLVNIGTLTLTNTVVSDNEALQGGGGGIVNKGTLTLINSAVSGNQALNDGGIDNLGTLTLIESSVTGNTAVTGNGGLANYGGTMTLIDSSVSGNTATGAGGIGNYSSGTTTLLNTTVSGNSAASAGGILNNATLTLTNSTVSDNTASKDGGIDNTGLLALAESTVSGNTAVQGNGGLANYGGTMALVNSTVTGNTANGVGGLGNYDNGTTTLLNTTVSGNSATGDVGGIFNTATMTVTDSTVSDNTALNDAGLNNSGALTLVESTVSGNTALLGNGGLANYGGTMALIDSTVTGNSAIGAGGLGNYDNGTTTLLNTTVSNNTAADAGGIFNTATMTLIDSTVSDNVASGAGGGIINSAALTLTDSTVVDNSANIAGGVGNYGGSVTLESSTVSDNTAVTAGGIVNAGTLTLTESTVSGNTAAVWNGGIVNYGGTMALVDSTVPGITDVPAGDTVDVPTLTLANSPVSDVATTATAENLTANNASLANSGALTASITSNESIPNPSSIGETDAPTLAGSSDAVPSADGTVNTGALFLNQSAVSGGPSVVGYDASIDTGDTLTPAESAGAGDSTSNADHSVPVTVNNNRLAADRAVLDLSVWTIQEEMTPISGRGEQDAALPSRSTPAQEQAAAVVSTESISVDAQAEPFILLNGESLLNPESSFRVELTTSNMAALLLVLPWLPSFGRPIEEPAESEELLKRNKICV